MTYEHMKETKKKQQKKERNSSTALGTGHPLKQQ